MSLKGTIVVRSFVVEVLIAEITKKYIENKTIRFMLSYGSYKSLSTIYCALYSMKCEILDFKKGNAVCAIEKFHAIFYGIENLNKYLRP